MAYSMPAVAASEIATALAARDVHASVGGGWAVDALLGEQTREHGDLDLWVLADDTEALFATCAELGLDRVLPWPGDRPWNFVLHDGVSRRVDLHFYERLGERFVYGGATTVLAMDPADVDGRGTVAGTAVRCESVSFSLRCHTGYPPREVDRRDVAALHHRFGLG